jgi:hypothetical protein
LKAHILYITICINILSFSTSSAQTYFVKPFVGSTYYQGDLAPKPIDFSFGPGNVSYGISAGMPIIKSLNAHVRYLRGRVSGSDKFSIEETRKQRNLSFRSHLDEISLALEYDVNTVWKSLNKYNLRLYLSAGLGVVFFDPMTEFNGEYLRLQPLGTEGQFLPNSSIKPYRLNSIVRPIGFNLEFPINGRLHLGLEGRSVKTYTDYLDDVSTTYPDYFLMFESGNLNGALLTNRSGELINSSQPLNRVGQSRGNSRNKDWYSSVGVYVKITLGKAKE